MPPPRCRTAAAARLRLVPAATARSPAATAIPDAQFSPAPAAPCLGAAASGMAARSTPTRLLRVQAAMVSGVPVRTVRLAAVISIRAVRFSPIRGSGHRDRPMQATRRAASVEARQATRPERLARRLGHPQTTTTAPRREAGTWVPTIPIATTPGHSRANEQSVAVNVLRRCLPRRNRR